MSVKDEEELQRIHIWLFKSDIERLHALYGKSFGQSKAVRIIVRQFLKRLNDALPSPDLAVSDPSTEALIREFKQ